jgi:hypothetical protein
MSDRIVLASDISSPGNEEESSSHSVAGEGGATWTVTMDLVSSDLWNDLTFWAVGDGVDLAIFTHPTMAPPP